MPKAINVKLALQTARDTGHFWDSKFPDLLNVKWGDVAKLTLKDKLAKLAIVSMQLADANLDDLVRKHHSRSLIADGEIGPATMELITGWNDKASPLVRCPLPDLPPPPWASFYYDDPDLQVIVEGMQRATGSGSIPAGCYGTAGVHEVKVSYDTSGLSAKQKEWFPEIKARHKAECAAMGLKIIEVPVGEKANVTFYARRFGGSTIGMAGFLGQSCGNVVFCTINPSYDPDLEMVLILVLHEHGHNWNLNHRPGFIMNPSIRRVKPKWVERDGLGKIIYQDPSYTADLVRFFGGGPLVVDTKPPPPPPPPPSPLIPVAAFDIAVPGRYKLFRDSPAPVPVPTQPVPT